MSLVRTLLDAAEENARRSAELASSNGRGMSSAAHAEEARTWAMTAEILVRAAQRADEYGLDGSPERVDVSDLTIPFHADGRAIVEAVVRETLKRAARVPSSFMGGKLVTGDDDER